MWRDRRKGTRVTYSSFKQGLWCGSIPADQQEYLHGSSVCGKIYVDFAPNPDLRCWV